MTIEAICEQGFAPALAAVESGRIPGAALGHGIQPTRQKTTFPHGGAGPQPFQCVGLHRHKRGQNSFIAIEWRGVFVRPVIGKRFRVMSL